MSFWLSILTNHAVRRDDAAHTGMRMGNTGPD